MKLMQRIAEIFGRRQYYNAVKPTRLKPWRRDITRSSRSNVPAKADARKLRNLARAMVRNRAEGTRLVEYLADRIVGEGIYPSFRTENAELNKLLALQFWLWARDCGVNGDSWCEIQSMWMRELATVGESFTVHERTARGYKLRVIEPEDLATSGFSNTRDEFIHDGIGYNAAGEIVAYYVQQPDPIGTGSKFQDAQRVTPSRMIHLMERWRPGQLRGISPFDSIATTLADVDEVDYAEVQLIKVASFFGLYLQQEGDPANDNSTIQQGDLDFTTEGSTSGTSSEEFIMEPGMVRTGTDKPHVIDVARPSGEYMAYRKAVLQSVSARMSVPYSVLTGDCSGMNYSSMRGDEMQCLPGQQKWQRLLRDRGCVQVLREWLRFVAAGPLSGALRGMDIEQIVRECDWVFPRRDWVDIKAEAEALKIRRALGLATYRQQCQAEGLDWHDQLTQIAEERALAEELGIADVVLTPEINILKQQQPRQETPEEEPANADA